ncbi:GIY-YIG nuclease family protein [Viridibacillus arvi]|uniref:GIY-YIG nuclease family protein n=1 Tax=Viridibacillus arvi TaxID=263475 RepID=UPI003D071737
MKERVTLINIEIPNYSEMLSVLEIHKVKSESGFYFMKDSSEKIVYIGESFNLRKRLNKHMTGTSKTTKRFCHVFNSIDVFYCGMKERKIYEIYAINLYDPIGNVDGNESASKEELIKRREEWIKISGGSAIPVDLK